MKNHIGIDVSKAAFGVVVVNKKKKIFTDKTTKDLKALKTLAKKLKKNRILLEKSFRFREYKIG